MKETSENEFIAMWIAETPISGETIVDLIRRQGTLNRIVQEWILDKLLIDIDVSVEERDRLIDKYKRDNNVQEKKDFENHLKKYHLNERLLATMLERPEKIYRYREERWGPVAQSLYLKNKEQFDLVSYNRLEATNPDVMQEIYFRLKDGEETWDGLAKQFPGANADTTALQGPTPVRNVEKGILDILRESEPGKVARPIKIDEQIVVVSLVKFEPSTYNDEIREALMRQAFDEWLNQESIKLLKNIRFSK